MSSTLDNINVNIIDKLGILQQILTEYGNSIFEEADIKRVVNMQKKLLLLCNNYKLESINILCHYYKQNITNDEKQHLYKEYIKYINTNNLIGDLATIYTFCNRIYNIYDLEYEANQSIQANKINIRELLKKYNDIPIDFKHDNILKSVCSCGGVLTIEQKTSEVLCSLCGSTKKIFGMIFEDEQFFYQEGQRTKHGKYDPSKHCKYWVDRIQGKEIIEIPNEVIDEIKDYLKLDNIYIDLIDCVIIRKYLKKLKLTIYNDHVPLIKKLITEKKQRQFNSIELKFIYTYFGKVTHIYNKIKPAHKTNGLYNPFIIYKIIEQLYISPEYFEIKIEVLSNIHLQSRNTLIMNDKIWINIIQFIPEFVYIPTSKNN